MEKDKRQYHDLRKLLIHIQIALNENRFEDALKLLTQIEIDNFSSISVQELHILGRLIDHIKEIAEQKRSSLVEEIKRISVAKSYLE